MFESQQDLEEASDRPFRYNNWLLKWIKKKETKATHERPSRAEDKKQTDAEKQCTDKINKLLGLDEENIDIEEWLRNKEREKAYVKKAKENKRKEKTQRRPKQIEESEVWAKIDQHQYMLQEIL